MRPKTKQVLLVDDEEKLLESISQRLELMGFRTWKATSGRAAVDIATVRPIDLAVVDLKMPDMDGLETIAKLKEIDPDLKTILLTGYGNEKIRQATNALGSDYFEKDEMSDFWSFIRKLSAEGKVVILSPPHNGGTADRPKAELVDTTGAPSTRFDKAQRGRFDEAQQGGGKKNNALPPVRPRIIGETPTMQELRKRIERVAALDCPVIIHGETGTGKELAARSIHALSSRKSHRFLAIHCGCFGNEQLTEQLLGPTDDRLDEALQTQTGILGAHPGGTVLLDQIEEMPPQMQNQLLKIIDAAENLRADEPTDGPYADVRILAASETDLRQAVKNGTFRKDLFYRLNLFELNIPPLRDRKDDIPPLSSFFLDRYRTEFRKQIQSIDEAVIEIFMAYDFPGNVRELEHIIERAVILADGSTIKTIHLPSRFKRYAAMPASAAADSLPTLAEVEIQHILRVLAATDQNKSKTAAILGISRAALWRKLKNFREGRHA